MIPVVLLVAPLARAADCAPLPEAALRDLVAEAKAAVDRDDLVSFAEARRNLFHDLPCLEGPLPVDAWARFLFDEAVVGYALGEAWEAPLGTALSLDPTLPRADLPQELRDWVSVPRPPVGAAPLTNGEFLLDGRPLGSVPELSGLHVVQRQEAGLWTTRVLRDTPFPDDWRAPVEVPPAAPVPLPPVAHPSREGGSHGSVPVVVTGLVVAVAGAGLGVGSWAVRGSVTDPAAGDRLILANVAGWGVAAAGTVLGTVGLVLPVSDTSPRMAALKLQGRF